MDSGWHHPWRDAPQAKSWNKSVEGQTDGARVDVPTISERKQGATGWKLAPDLFPDLDIVAETLLHARAEGNQPGFGELGVSYDQETILEINIIMVES